MRNVTLTVALVLLLSCVARAQEEVKLNVPALEQASGRKGEYDPATKVFRISVPRDEIKGTVDGVKLPSFMGLTSWAAIKPGHGEKSMVMGDIVLLQDEVGPAMSAALSNGIDVTALHNHFFYDEPRVFFMHVGGEGHAEQLAAGVGKVLDAVAAVRKTSAEPGKSFAHASLPEKSDINAASMDEIFGTKGASKDGMYKAVWGKEVTMACNCQVGKEMGVTTWAAMYGAADNALIDGDFACTMFELQPVLKTLRGGGINIVAIHNHMDSEAPRLFFLHYWGIGKAADLAKAVKAAIDAQGGPTIPP